MSVTLTYGRIKPEAEDIGDEVFDALENNIDINDAHTHDGITSPLIPSINIAKVTQSISSDDWTLVGDGVYKQIVIMPQGSYDTSMPVFRDALDGSQYFLKTERITANQYEVYINDSSKDLNIFYV